MGTYTPSPPNAPANSEGARRNTAVAPAPPTTGAGRSGGQPGSSLLGHGETPAEPDAAHLWYEFPTEEEMRLTYPRLWVTILSDFPDLGTASQLQIAGLALGRGICGACHNAESGCHCANDE